MLRMRPSRRLSSAGSCTARGWHASGDLAARPADTSDPSLAGGHYPQHVTMRPGRNMVVPAGKPSWAVNAGLDGHTSGPDDAYTAQDEPTADRVILHAGDNGCPDEQLGYVDERKLQRATRRQAKPAARQFARRLALPEDECAVVHERREEQEDEWRRILRRQRGAPSSVSTTTDARTQATTLTAGMRVDHRAWRCEDNGCAAVDKLCIAVSRGDQLPRRPPLPLGKASTASSQPSEECVGVGTVGRPVFHGVERLGRLLELGSRPM